MTFPKKSIKLYHLPTAAGSTQAYPSSPDVTVPGIVLPLNRQDALLAGNDLVDPWEVYVPAGTDVRLEDKVIVAGDSANYYVRNIFTANFGGIAHRRVTVSTKK